MPTLSVIVSILDSHEALRRQLVYLNQILTPDCELILVDDGSLPPLRRVCDAASTIKYRLTICQTRDARPWTQPRGRNIGAHVASGDRLLFFDVDHILTREIITNALAFQGDRFHWHRKPAILDAAGELVTNMQELRDCGWNGEELGIHWNSFLIRRELFESLGGYDEGFCGRYGGDDIDFNQRYERYVEEAKATPAIVLGHGYVFPSPSTDRMQLFHQLSRG